MKRVILFLFLFSYTLPICIAQAGNPLTTLDVTQYRFSISIVAKNDSIYGNAIITGKVLKPTTELLFNLKNLDKAKKGMTVLQVLDEKSKPLSFVHQKDLLAIKLSSKLGQIFTVSIIYAGIPTNGLVIGKNKFSKKTWFGDNWPNRAAYWLPCVDHPLDKATVQWTVKAPKEYVVVANGLLTTEKEIANQYKEWNFIEKNPIPTKVAVIGIAALKKKCNTLKNGIEVCNYFYPETYKVQPTKMDIADSILLFFSNTIGDYPFQKLNNVQSTTMFGGMENANNIFYDEYAVDGVGSIEALIAHEIAHQWFGNTVTEKDFAHLWLSEGFATFFTNYYLEKKYGVDTLRSRLKDDIAIVKSFLITNKRIVIDSNTNYMSLLNANSYQKGGLFLQALREKMGDDRFFTVIKTYYQTYKYQNANTDDFRSIVESITKEDYKPFFKDWLYSTSLPAF
jgi:aminopeptidase N